MSASNRQNPFVPGELLRMQKGPWMTGSTDIGTHLTFVDDTHFCVGDIGFVVDTPYPGDVTVLCNGTIIQWSILLWKEA